MMFSLWLKPESGNMNVADFCVLVWRGHGKPEIHIRVTNVVTNGPHADEQTIHGWLTHRSQTKDCDGSCEGMRLVQKRVMISCAKVGA
jgi:hypothetical protein